MSTTMPDESTFNSGSQLLQPLSAVVGLSVDKINFVLCMIICVPISLWFSSRFSLAKVSRQTRLIVPPIIGLVLCLFMYGSAFKHVLALALVNYAFIWVTPINHIHRVVFVFSIGYMSWIHWFRVAHLTHYAIDISGPMMLVQRVITLAFNLHDGIYKTQKGEALNELQQKEAVRCIPSPLEYFSYMLNYQQIFCGPLCFYTDYIAWIDETHLTPKTITVNGESKEVMPDFWPAVRDKCCIAVGCLCIVLVCEPYFSLDSLVDLNGTNMLYWLWRMHWALVVVRCQYYFAWVTADAVNNASGFGFSGYNKDTGAAEWNLISNVFILPVEFGLSWKVLVDNWNMSTLRWLRRVSYDRVHLQLRTPVTYLLSAWWHGFFPAYYILFLQGALLTSAAKRARRSFRHHFQGSVVSQRLYDVITFIATRAFTAYVTFPFVYIWTTVPLHLYKQMYFAGHILLMFALVALPYLMPAPKSNVLAKQTLNQSHLKHQSNGTKNEQLSVGKSPEIEVNINMKYEGNGFVNKEE